VKDSTDVFLSEKEEVRGSDETPVKTTLPVARLRMEKAWLPVLSEKTTATFSSEG
jgi:hypothetical protein